MAIRWRTPERDEPKPRPMIAAPDLHPAVSAPDMVMRMQATAGNQATIRMLAASGAPGAVERVAREASTPLLQRAALERALGTDLRDVRVQLGGARARTALHARSAHAAAVDRSIVFDDTAPTTEVIAHEVAHVLQQHRGRTRAPDGDCENEARLSAPRLARGEATVLQASASPGRAQYLGFTQGAPTAPVINHDHGFLDTVVGGQHTRDASKLRAPTLRDRAALAHGELMLEGAEMLRPDLIDGTRGYRHFLHGNGAPLTIEYDRFLMGDAAGQPLLARALTDTRAGAIEQDNTWMAANPGAPVAGHSFQMQSEVFANLFTQEVDGQRSEVSLIELAHNHVRRLVCLRADADPESDTITSSLCQFDALAAFIAVDNASSLEGTHFYGFLGIDVVKVMVSTARAGGAV